jgi:hypothetical protein
MTKLPSTTTADERETTSANDHAAAQGREVGRGAIGVNSNNQLEFQTN